MRKTLKITSRTSSITNSFVQAIIPTIHPTDDERRDALAALGMSPAATECIYCGGAHTDWDHLFPLVRSRRPTGYINEIRNLVPSCAPCNQSKSGRDWREWILSRATGSPTTRGISNVQERIARLENFVSWGGLKPLSLEKLAGKELWEKYWSHLAIIDVALSTAQREAEQVRKAIAASLASAQDSGA